MRIKINFVIVLLFVILNNINGQKTDFKPSGNLWGYVYGDYYYVGHSDSLGRGAGNVQYKPFSTTSTLNSITGVSATTTSNASGDVTSIKLASTKSDILGSGTNNYTSANAFQIRRFYLGYDYQFTPKLTAYTLVADEQNLDESGYNTLFLKYAYIKWLNIFPNSNLLIGQQGTPSFVTPAFATEPLWGYRSIERTIMDMHNNDAAVDLGVSVEGLVWKGFSGDSIKPDIFGYFLQFGNGNSVKPENDGFKNLRLSLYTSLMQQKLTLGFYTDFHTASLSPVTEMVHTYKGYISYRTRKFRIGTEMFTQDWFNGAQLSTSTVANPVFRDVQMFGWSVFLSGKIVENLNFFGRFDIYNPDIRYHNADTYTSVPSIITPSYVQTQTLTTSLSPFSITGATPTSTVIDQAAVFSKQTFIALGFDYTPDKRFHIMPNIWLDDFKSLVNVPAGAVHANKDYDFVPRITFYYLFNQSKFLLNNGMDN